MLFNPRLTDLCSLDASTSEGCCSDASCQLIVDLSSQSFADCRQALAEYCGEFLALAVANQYFTLFAHLYFFCIFVATFSFEMLCKYRN